MANQQNVSFDLGETWEVDFTACDGNGVALADITGATVALYLKVGSATLMVPSQSTGVVVNGPKAQAKVTVTPAQQVAANLTAMVASYVIRLTLVDGVTVSDQLVGSWAINGTAAG